VGSLALDQTYLYPFASRLIKTAEGSALRLATCGGACDHPYFFEGRLRRPGRAAALLRGLVDVVQSRFYIPPAMLARILAQYDPVVTSSGDVLRLEAFSACCSIYARVDLLPAAVEGQWHGSGTTNVDFNAPIRSALAQVRDSDKVRLSVGADALELSREGASVIERKVSLPVRWLKGFVEIQSYQARMKARLELSGFEANRFLRSLPSSSAKSIGWIVPSGRGLRFSQVEDKNGVRIGDVRRLEILNDLARHARHLRVYADPASGTTAWELVLDEARFTMVLSPDSSRGLSGEGQALEPLAQEQSKAVLARVYASLKWQTRIDDLALAQNASLQVEGIRNALAALGSRGLVGYDLTERAYFHRELPFNLELVESLHPRLKDARRLVIDGGVRMVPRPSGPGGEEAEAFVRGAEVEHRVRIGPGGAKCTCPWFAKHQGTRGPCKHILAVKIVMSGDHTDELDF
jgi:SWIM zinc finger